MITNTIARASVFSLSTYPSPNLCTSELPRKRSCKIGTNFISGTGDSRVHDDTSFMMGRNSGVGVLRSVHRRALPKGTDGPPPALEPVSVVDDEGKVEGVIQVERDEAPQPTWGRVYALAGGDIVFLLLFAAIGRVSHGFPGLEWETVRTADPFLAGWLIASYFTGGYGPEGQGLQGTKVASIAAVKSWAVGIPLALIIRGFKIGHVPATPFILVSLASTLILQVGWRTAFTALFPNDEISFRKKKDNRKGSPFEFFELLTSLVKRW